MRRKIVFFFSLLIILSSCKIKYSLSGATIPAEAKTISVAFFENNTTLGSPSLSQKFTEKLRDQVSSQTNLSLMSRNGDLHFEGFITDYNVAPVAIQSNDIAGLNRLTISVQVKYRNKIEASKNFEQVFTRFADYKSSENLNSVEDELVKEIFRQITEDVFNRAFNDW